MKPIFTLLLLTISLSSFSQLKIPKGYTELKESPANGRKIEKVEMDFDNDKSKDVLMLIKSDTEFSKFKLLIYLTSLKKLYEIDLYNSNDFSIYPIQLKVIKNTVEFGYFEDGTATFGRFIKLRFNSTNKKIQVIGYDSSYKSSPTEFIAKSYNLLTGKYIVKRTKIAEKEKSKTQEFFGTNHFFKNKVFVENLNEEMYKNLDDVGSKYE